MNKPLRFQIVSDIHGILKDQRACDAALAFRRDFKPDIRIIAGDIWDFGAIRKGASDEERSVSMRDDFDSGREFADEFFVGGGVKHMMLGNHDLRPFILAQSPDAVRRDLGEKMVHDIKEVARRASAKLWPYDARTGVLELGHLRVLHGYHTGMNACAAHARIYGNCVFGHIHSIESFQTPGLQQKEARSIGCLCDLNPDYANTKTGKLKWGHGFAFGFLFSDGSYTINQVRDTNGVFYAQTDLKGY